MGFVPFDALIREPSDEEELQLAGSSFEDPASAVVIRRDGDRLFFGREFAFTKRTTSRRVVPQRIAGVDPGPDASEHRWCRLEFCYGGDHYSQIKALERQVKRQYLAARQARGDGHNVDLTDVEQAQLKKDLKEAVDEFVGEKLRKEEWFDFNGYRLVSAVYPWHQHWIETVPIKRTSKRGESERYDELRLGKFDRPEDVRAFIESMYDDSKARFGQDPISYDFFDHVPRRFVASIPDVWWPTDLAPSEPGRRRARSAQRGSGYCLAAIDGDIESLASLVAKSAPVQSKFREAMHSDYATKSKGVRAAMAEPGRKRERLGLEPETLERLQRMTLTASRKALAGPRHMHSYPLAENLRDDGESWEGHEVGELAALILKTMTDNVDDQETSKKDPDFKGRRKSSSANTQTKVESTSGDTVAAVDAMALSLVEDESDAWQALAHAVDTNGPLTGSALEESLEHLGRSLFELLDLASEVASAAKVRDTCTRVADLIRRSSRSERLLQCFTSGIREALESDSAELRDEAEYLLSRLSRKS